MKNDKIEEKPELRFYIDTLKTNIQFYNIKCSRILNLKEVTEVARVFCKYRNFENESLKKVYDIKIENVGQLARELKGLVSINNYSLVKIEFIFLYLFETYVRLFKSDKGSTPEIIELFIIRELKILKGKAKHPKEPTSIFKEKNSILINFPRIHYRLNINKTKSSKNNSTIKHKKKLLKNNKFRKTSWKEFCFLFFCKLESATTNKSDRNLFYKKYLPEFYKQMPLLFSSKNNYIEIGIGEFVDKFNETHDGLTFKDYPRSTKTLVENIESAFNDSSNGDMFGFHYGGFQKERFNNTVEFLKSKYEVIIDDKLLKIFDRFKRNPTNFIN